MESTKTSSGARIIQAESPADLDAIRALFQEYVAWLGVDLAYQGFAAELAGLPGYYAPPRGRLLLARIAGQAAGCVAVRPLAESVCEMKRLFVRPAFRRHGLGRQLAMASVSEARAMGYSIMRLDTLPFIKEALSLYDSMGFKPCPPYYNTPLADTIFLELKL